MIGTTFDPQSNTLRVDLAPARDLFRVWRVLIDFGDHGHLRQRRHFGEHRSVIAQHGHRHIGACLEQVALGVDQEASLSRRDRSQDGRH